MFLCLILTWVLKPETQETFLQAHWLTHFVHTQMNLLTCPQYTSVAPTNFHFKSMVTSTKNNNIIINPTQPNTTKAQTTYTKTTLITLRNLRSSTSKYQPPSPHSHTPAPYTPDSNHFPK